MNKDLHSMMADAGLQRCLDVLSDVFSLAHVSILTEEDVTAIEEAYKYENEYEQVQSRED